MATGSDKRIIFAIPRKEIVILGTTDTDFKDNPTDVSTQSQDVSYLLQIVNTYFPKFRMVEEDIIASYSGVRPLVHDGSSSESKTSREHTIFSDDRNITFVAGGKYTTYRNMAEQVVDQTLSFFSFEERVKFSECKTVSPLNPSVTTSKLWECLQQTETLSADFGVSGSEVSFLTERHGEEAIALMNQSSGLPKGDSWVWRLEARHAIETGMCFRLDDFYLRRVPLFLAKADHGVSLLEDVADEFSDRLGWSDQERKTQLETINDHLRREMGWRHSK